MALLTILTTAFLVGAQPVEVDEGQPSVVTLRLGERHTFRPKGEERCGDVKLTFADNIIEPQKFQPYSDEACGMDSLSSTIEVSFGLETPKDQQVELNCDGIRYYFFIDPASPAVQSTTKVRALCLDESAVVPELSGNATSDNTTATHKPGPAYGAMSTRAGTMSALVPSSAPVPASYAGASSVSVTVPPYEVRSTLLTSRTTSEPAGESSAPLYDKASTTAGRSTVAVTGPTVAPSRTTTVAATTGPDSTESKQSDPPAYTSGLAPSIEPSHPGAPPAGPTADHAGPTADHAGSTADHAGSTTSHAGSMTSHAASQNVTMASQAMTTAPQSVTAESHLSRPSAYAADPSTCACNVK